MDPADWLIMAHWHLQALIPRACPDTALAVGPMLHVYAEAVGECWLEPGPVAWIRISPTLTDPTEVLAVLLHEMLHSIVGPQRGHGLRYRHLWRRVGFRDDPECSTPGPWLARELRLIAGRLPVYPALEVVSV